MAYCINCGKSLPYYAEYCPNCGTKAVIISLPKENFKSKEESAQWNGKTEYNEPRYTYSPATKNDECVSKIHKEKNYGAVIRLLLFLIIAILAIGLKAHNIDIEFQKEKQLEETLLQEAYDDPIYRYFGSNLQNEDGIDYLQYLKIANAVETFQPTVSLKSDSGDRLEDLAELVYFDYPEYFWFEGFADSEAQNSGTYTLNIEYTFPKVECEERTEKLEDSTHYIMARIKDKSEYEKVKIVYDYLTRHITYDGSDMDQTCYSVLVESRGVCAGYASAFNYILNKAGMKSIYAAGEVYQEGKIILGNTSHAWNLVNISGNWYHVDVTWGDRDKEDGKTISDYDYFLVSDKEIMTSHRYDAGLTYPSCITTYN